MYIVSGMIFTFSIRDFGHPQFLKSQFGHPVMRILSKSQYGLMFEFGVIANREGVIVGLL